MPADHINIQCPDRYAIDGEQFRKGLETERLRIEIQHLRIWYQSLENNLTAIFTRIERGDTAELHYPDGRVFVITGTERK